MEKGKWKTEDTPRDGAGTNKVIARDGIAEALAKIGPDYSVLLKGIAPDLTSFVSQAKLAEELLAPQRALLAELGKQAAASMARLNDLGSAMPTQVVPRIDEAGVPLSTTATSEVWAVRAVGHEIGVLTKIMAESAGETKRQAEIGASMLSGIQLIGTMNAALVDKNAELISESRFLRATLEAGQATSEKLDRRILAWTLVLMAFTVVLAILAIPVAVDAAIRVAQFFHWLPSAARIAFGVIL